eukprot:CAMPEP_0117851096 /NCGR_PEP_ID=MMETSP0949-20121206/22145_1 /TAXON_ID=44440 /ORGANISM="Chattonella subsalsa, Strain CCMP2191" /LENGTH=92 /DNA_ID=CAMNT_0005698747 /DNA_START=275 /DNA_END=549 /DNA_ORIENTATION=-
MECCGTIVRFHFQVSFTPSDQHLCDTGPQLRARLNFFLPKPFGDLFQVSLNLGTADVVKCRVAVLGDVISNLVLSHPPLGNGLWAHHLLPSP